MGFVELLKKRAKESVKTIVLPETEDMRTLEATDKILKEGVAKIILIGNEEEINKKAAEGGFDISGAQIVDPEKSDRTQAYIDKFVEELSKIGIVPVIALDDAKDAEPLAKALIEGGLPCAEVTFRTAAAEESIRIMAEKFPELVVGAGTVLTPEQADRAMNAGAKFIVSPGLNPKVVKHCLDKGYPIVPGTSNPSDVETAIELGLDVVKFFPAEAAGGLNMIKSMAAPYTNMKFMPTGGINAGNLKSYLDFGKIVCCGGSWMVKKDMVAAGDFEGIKNLTREAVDTMLGFEVRHVGVNLQSGEEAEDLADTFNKMFSFEKKVGNSSVFSGTGFELMKKQGRGTHGHIAIATNYIERAIYHLEKRGFEFDKDSAVIKNDRLKAIYFKGEFGGFAIHLVQK